MDALLVSLLLWLNTNTEIQYNGPLPSTVETDVVTLVEIECKCGKEQAELIASRMRSMGASIVGMYIPDSQTMYLATDELDLADDFGVSFIIHELVHHIQFQQGKLKKVACVQKLEHEAYTIQNMFLAEHDLESKMFSDIHIFQRSLCPPNR